MQPRYRQRKFRPVKHTPAPVITPPPELEPEEPEKIFNVKKIIGIVIVVILFVGIIAVGIVFLLNNSNKTENNQPSTTPETPTVPEEKNEPPQLIDFQLAVDQWVSSQASRDNSGIMIFDIDNNEVVARHNEDTEFYIASIYKMFVAYEGYYRIDRGLWDGEETYDALGNDIDGNKFTRLKCLDYMIRYSYSSCAETMWSEIGRDKLQQIFDEKGFLKTNISSFTSTPSDLVKLYKFLYKHTNLSEESWEKLQNSMLEQEAPKNATSVYKQNWRQGLPSGFSTAKVYNKVGWYGEGITWYSYDDAAFVNFPETVDKDTGEKRPERHYIIVVLTKNTYPNSIIQLGRKIEEIVKLTDNYL